MKFPNMLGTRNFITAFTRARHRSLPGTIWTEPFMSINYHTPLPWWSLCVQTGPETHPASCTICTGGPSPGGGGVTLTTHPCLVPRSWISRAIPPLPPTPPQVCCGTALLLPWRSLTLRPFIFWGLVLLWQWTWKRKGAGIVKLARSDARARKAGSSWTSSCAVKVFDSSGW
jgi:hypothetical protein